MTDLNIRILISLACVAVIYAFACQIRLSREAVRIADWLAEEYPDLWQGLNPVARNWHGGHPAIKLLYRNSAERIPGLSRRYLRLQSLERSMILGVIVGMACIALVFVGTRFWGWSW